CAGRPGDHPTVGHRCRAGRLPGRVGGRGHGLPVGVRGGRCGVGRAPLVLLDRRLDLRRLDRRHLRDGPRVDRLLARVDRRRRRRCPAAVAQRLLPVGHPVCRVRRFRAGRLRRVAPGRAPGAGGAGAVSEDPYRPFRPRRGAIAARVTAVVTVASFVTLAVVIPGEGPFGWGPVDRVLLVLFGLAGAAFVWRYSQLRAIPSPTGLKVVNLVRTHDLEWAQILGVAFSGGAPWAVLE